MERLNELEKLIGNTPAIEITYKYNGNIRKVISKCEWYNLTGSIKDRVALQIIKDAYASGELSPETPIVEVSSGNMGISLSAVGSFLGHKVTILMPKSMSIERKKLLTMYGAKLIETDDFHQAFSLCEKMVTEGYYCPSQFKNSSNTLAHATTTAQELLKVITPEYTTFVAGIGTSGTLSGVGEILNQYHIECIAVEPDQARIITRPPPYSHHMLQGLSDEILPSLYNNQIVSSIIPITDNDAIAMTQKLCKQLSLGVGISSGANFLGCVLSGENAITIFPDDNKKYLSTTLSTPITTPIVDSIDFLSIKCL